MYLIMKKLKEELKYGKKGITLISLVVTIIVLLILAGVTIATLTGETGILNQATKAKEETQIASEDELRKLTMLEATTNLENTIQTDKNNETITIPAGFAVSQIEGENTISDGLVIIDSNGNEFVWIPVKVDEVFKTYEGYSNGKLESKLENCEEPYSGGYTTELSEYVAMKNSVLQYDGFYVGRYEAGCETERNRENQTTPQKVLVKKEINVYNYVPWGNAMDDIGITTNHEDDYNGVTGAVELSKNFAKENGYISVTSTLIYGVQWDAIMNFIDSNYATGSCEADSFVRDSTGSGVYTGNLAKTGSNKQYSIKNIYDLAGNANEWTMEAYDTSSRVIRGRSLRNFGY